MMFRFLQSIFKASGVLRQAADNSHIVRDHGVGVHPFEIHRSVEIRNPDQVNIKERCRIQPRVILNGRTETGMNGISLGPGSYIKEGSYLDAYSGYIKLEGECAISQGCYIHGGGGVEIGKYVMIGPLTAIISSNHRYKSTELPFILQGEQGRGVKIHDNVWIGANCTILDGVVIGENSVIAAGSLVKEDIPSGTLFANGAERRVCRPIEWDMDA